MSDLINRQDAVDCVRWGDSVTKVIDRIKSLPSADRPKGEWIKVESTSRYKDLVYGRIYYQCPFCMNVSSEDSNFCPNCGAYMRGDIE